VALSQHQVQASTAIPEAAFPASKFLYPAGSEKQQAARYNHYILQAAEAYS
jgi:hypothetical protein